MTAETINIIATGSVKDLTFLFTLAVRIRWLTELRGAHKVCLQHRTVHCGIQSVHDEFLTKR
jgi:hypothetical protein